MSITVSINGIQKMVDGQKTILEVCREAGVYIPTLCHDDRLEVRSPRPQGFRRSG